MSRNSLEYVTSNSHELYTIRTKYYYGDNTNYTTYSPSPIRGKYRGRKENTHVEHVWVQTSHIFYQRTKIYHGISLSEQFKGDHFKLPERSIQQLVSSSMRGWYKQTALILRSLYLLSFFQEAEHQAEISPTLTRNTSTQVPRRRRY